MKTKTTRSGATKARTNGKPPVNIRRLVKDLEVIKECLKTNIQNCEMALTGKWDKGDEGFRVEQDSNEEALEIMEKIIRRLSTLST